jgi:hypothetical protein
MYVHLLPTKDLDSVIKELQDFCDKTGGNLIVDKLETFTSVEITSPYILSYVRRSALDKKIYLRIYKKESDISVEIPLSKIDTIYTL